MGKRTAHASAASAGTAGILLGPDPRTATGQASFKGWNPEKGVFFFPEGRGVMPGVALRQPNGLAPAPRRPIVTAAVPKRWGPYRPKLWPRIRRWARRVDFGRKLAWATIGGGSFIIVMLGLASARADAFLGPIQ